MNTRRLAMALVAACVMTVPARRPARAEVAEQHRLLARSLFDQGRKLMADKKYFEACAKFSESQQLDPAPGTLLNLATCHEELGRTATAWLEFHDSLTQALRDGRPERVKYAQEHIDKLRPQLSYITVSIARGADIQGLDVKFDDLTLGRAFWGAAWPVDPGFHTVTATAPRRRGWARSTTVAPGGDRQTMVVPVLADEKEPVAAGTVAVASAVPIPAHGTAGIAAGNMGPGALRHSVHPTNSSEPQQRTVGLVVGGAGVLALGVGTVFGIQALSSWSERNAHCGPAGCDQAGVSSGEDAKTSAWVSNIGVGVGLAALAVGSYLFFSAPRARDKPSVRGGLIVTPSVGDRSIGLAVGGWTW